VNEILSKKIKDAIIIAPNELRNYFILLKNNDLNLNYKFFTKDEVLKELFGTYNEQAIRYLMKANYETYNTAKKHLNYLTSGASNLINHEALDKQNLIYTDEYSKKLYSMSFVLFIGYSKDDLEIKHIIDFLNLENYEFYPIKDLELKENSKEYSSFESKGQEVRYVLNKIAENLKNTNKKPSDIEIICNLSDYKFYLSTFSNSFGIPLNFSERDTLFETYSAKIILNNLDNIKEIFADETSFKNDLDNFKLIKYLYDFYDLENDPDFAIDLIQILKDFKIKEPKYVNGVKVTSSFSFDETKDYYLLGAIDSLLPKIYDDNDLISDETKSQNFLTTSIVKNEYSFDITLTFLKFNKLISITYPRENGKNEIAFLLKNNGFKEKKLNVMFKQYSDKVAELYFYDYNFKFNFFREENIEFPFLKNNFEVKKMYSHAYKVISKKNFEKRKYSYSSIENYIECPFRYYCDKVLKLNYFEDTIATNFGKFGHAVFEHVYDADFDFDKVVSEVKKDFVFNFKEEALLYRFISELKTVVLKIQEQNSKYPLSKTYHEKIINLDFDKYFLTGQVDRINIYKNSLVIIDYKTGNNFNFDDYFFKNYALSMQLPTYLLMISKLDELKDYKTGALLYQPIGAKKFYNYYSPNKDAVESKKMSGLINGDKNILCEFDGSILFDSSEYILGAKLNKNNQVVGAKGLIVLSNDEFEILTEYASNFYQKFDEQICNNEFQISPYKIKEKNEACTYCNYKDICYHDDGDYRVLEKPNDEEGGDENGTN